MSTRERILYEGENEFDDIQIDKASLGETTSTGGRSKHQSMDFSGSVFLIASNGHVLSLPIPSESPNDPLNWTKTRRSLIGIILLLYGSITLFTVQTPGVLYTAFITSFKKEVRHHYSYPRPKRSETRNASRLTTHLQDMAPFTVSTLASCPTLALGISFFFWMPLSVGFGRRANMTASSALFLCAVLGAGFARGFHELLAALCVVGAAAGASISTVGFRPSTTCSN